MISGADHPFFGSKSETSMWSVKVLKSTNVCEIKNKRLDDILVFIHLTEDQFLRFRYGFGVVSQCDRQF